MYERLAERRAVEALEDTPAVLVVGPRRAGKTTLVRKVGDGNRTYITLDDPVALAAARSDPTSFVRGIGRASIDEVQRAPALLLAIKKAVDEAYRPGQFLLTGSANVLTMPRVADSLAGRIETIEMLPLARAEIAGRPATFLQRLYRASLQSQQQAILGDELTQLVLLGGFPELLIRETERRRQDWARAYLSSLLTRDVRDIASIDKTADLPRFARLLAEHAGQLVNYSQLGSGIGVSYKTGQRYLSLLEQVFLVRAVQPWFTSTLKRLIKSPKLHFLDAGVLAAARGLTFARAQVNRKSFGPVLESFVFAEVLKLLTVSDLRATPFHFRDRDGHEVDIVLERDDGMVVGIEVKASASITPSDFAGLRALAAACKERFAFGVVLHDTRDVVHFGDRLAAAPLSCLWA